MMHLKATVPILIVNTFILLGREKMLFILKRIADLKYFREAAVTKEYKSERKYSRKEIKYTLLGLIF